jgi:hypothetical protein
MKSLPDPKHYDVWPERMLDLDNEEIQQSVSSYGIMIVS